MKIVRLILDASKNGIVRLGRYSQRKETAPQAIEWLVLDRNTNSVTLISQKGLALYRFNSSRNANWRDSVVREWLNNEFLHTAFSDEEIEFIQPVTIKTEVKKMFGNPMTTETKDKVFLMSVSEAKKRSSISLITHATDDVIKKARSVGLDSITGGRDSDVCWWWLLTNDGNAKNAPIVYLDGKVVENPAFNVRDYGVVRPMIVLSIPKPNQ